MSKHTIFLYDYLQAELLNSGKSEFYDQNQLQFFNDDYAFMQKIITYDTDVAAICQKRLFKNFTLQNSSFDFLFKQAFINRFFNRQIQTQTIESFVGKLLSVLLKHLDFLNTYANKYNELLTGQNDQTGTQHGKSTNDSRDAFQSNSQDFVNIDVDNTNLLYADNNSVARNKNVSESDQVSKSNQFNIDTFLKTFDLLEPIFIELDQKCFMQKW